MAEYYVYKYTNDVDGKVYIGQTRLSKEKREGKNGSNYKVCPVFWDAISTFGWDHFYREILEDNLEKEEAEMLERKYIEEYRSNNPIYGYNVQAGGTHLFGEENMFYGKTHSNETRQAVANANRQRVWKETSKQKAREKLSGENSPSRKPVVCVKTNIIYATIKIAAEAMNVTLGKICDVLKGRHKTCRGYHWVYANP